MKILIIGNGGRESALAAKLKNDSRISKMFFAKGNATTEQYGQNVNEDTVAGLRDFAIRERIDLTIVGPEQPLINGIVDDFKNNGLRIFGPRQRTAQLESHTAFAKKFMQMYNVKTARGVVFDAYEDALQYVRQSHFPLVIKAGGLFGGKGVEIVDNLQEAEAAIHSYMIEKIYGENGIQVVIEEYLAGFHTSIVAFSNGATLQPALSVKNYIHSGKGNTGAHTGGMGAVAPHPEFTEAHMQDLTENILKRTQEGLRGESINFKGFLHFGLIVTKNGPYLLEYNMRLGDPEAQVILELMENNLLDVITDCLEGNDFRLSFRNQKAVCLVICSGGYPREIETGFEIKGLNKVQHSKVFFAGAKKQGDRIITSGGRVMSLVATGDSYKEASDKVYADAGPVHFDYDFYREDIGKF